MKPIPVAFHIGPLEVHTYGIGLAIAFWFAYVYFVPAAAARRLSAATGSPACSCGSSSPPWSAPGRCTSLSNLSYYGANPGDIFAIWHGGLSSFGGHPLRGPDGHLAGPPALSRAHRGRGARHRRPGAHGGVGDRPAARAPAHGGRRRPPDPPVVRDVLRRPGRQAAPGARSSRRSRTSASSACSSRSSADSSRWPDGTPAVRVPGGDGARGRRWCSGAVERFLDEHLWLGEEGHLGSVLVQVAGIALAVGGLALLVVTRRRWNAWRRAGAPGGRASDEGSDADVAGADESADEVTSG